MKILQINLENCYGIKSLQADLDFTSGNSYAIYAPNGMMKTSFAHTLKDYSENIDSIDRIYPSNICIRSITDDHGNKFPPDSVYVISPYDESFGCTEKTSTLLVDNNLRKQYEQLYFDIDKSKDNFLKAMKNQSGSKKDLEREISLAFSLDPNMFFDALLNINLVIINQQGAPFKDIPYDKIFDDKVLEFLENVDVKSALENYIRKYNELLDHSNYFKKGVFNYYHASNVAKSLADNGFFQAQHSLTLNADQKLEVTSQTQLSELINTEKGKITNDATLLNKYREIEKLITKNANVRDFWAYIEKHEEILPFLVDVGNFRREVWKSYIIAQKGYFQEIISKYQSGLQRKKQIEETASKQRTQWESVIEIFNNRFFVPFKLIPENKTSVILGQDQMLAISFVYEDDGNEVIIDRDELMQVLSTGEKKALYILNIIFEVEARKKASQETLFVFDDIADSFDYRNKYAIIQYLQDINETPIFKQIILTHNFDFFRTIQSRFIIYNHCRMTIKSSDRIELIQAKGIKNIFVNDWKRNFFTDPKKRIASIPFIRNLIEFTKGDEDENYKLLTSLLHQKSDSNNIAQRDLDNVYNTIFGTHGFVDNQDELVIEVIFQEAMNCLGDGIGINLENKIILSIAIRLKAEQFMIDHINDPDFVNSITDQQTYKLLKKYQESVNNMQNEYKVLQRVILMTTENIHLNSFMYEPIIDISDEHLRKLYNDVINL